MEYLENKSLGIGPMFTRDVRRRVRKKKACNIVVVGEAGEGKSYTAMQIARHIDKNFGSLKSRYNKLDPDYNLPQVVFSYKTYLEILLKLGMGHPIVFDEPSYAMGKREWYKQVNQALVKTVESARFMVKPLIIPIINMNLLDKTIRSYLIQYLVMMMDRGRALAYRIQASQHRDKVYRYFMCSLHYGLLENDICDKTSCLGCRQLKNCQTIRARYERKKASIQLSRYAQDLEEVSAKEDQNLTIDQLVSIVYPHFSEYTDDGKLNTMLMQTILREKLGIRIGRNKSYELASALKYRYPDSFFDN